MEKSFNKIESNFISILNKIKSQISVPNYKYIKKLKRIDLISLKIYLYLSSIRTKHHINLLKKDPNYFHDKLFQNILENKKTKYSDEDIFKKELEFILLNYNNLIAEIKQDFKINNFNSLKVLKTNFNIANILDSRCIIVYFKFDLIFCESINYVEFEKDNRRIKYSFFILNKNIGIIFFNEAAKIGERALKGFNDPWKLKINSQIFKEDIFKSDINFYKHNSKYTLNKKINFNDELWIMKKSVFLEATSNKINGMLTAHLSDINGNIWFKNKSTFIKAKESIKENSIYPLI